MDLQTLICERNEFFERLHKLVEMEEAEEIQQFKEEFLKKTPEERERAGKALLRLGIRESHFSPGGHRLITLSYRDGRPLPVFSLDLGDVVSLSRDGQDLFDLPTGTVYEKTADSLTVAFDWLRDEWMDEDCQYHLNRAGNRATYKRMQDALGAVRGADRSYLALLRDLSFGIEKPSRKPADQPPTFFNPSLNEWQREAVIRGLECEQVALLHGPPGTGKTTVLVEIIQQSVQAGQFVYATAPSNTACDNLLEGLVRAGVPALRLGHPARIMKHLREHTLDFKTANHPQAAEIDEIERELQHLFRKKDKKFLPREEYRELNARLKQLKNEKRDLGYLILSQVIGGAPVMVGTHTAAADRMLRRRGIDLVVMDEATQATEPSSWIALQGAKKVVLAGDHFQLPPTVRSKMAEQKGLAKTLFERFHRLLGEDYTTLLRVQYRMHEKIMAFSSAQFYDSKLIADASVKDHTLADLDGVQRKPEMGEALIFLDTAGRGYEEKLEPGSESRYNAEEAKLVLAKLKLHLEAGVRPEQIAVISPYSAQVRLLLSRMPSPAIEVDSVDGFQGREKELVIVSLVRSNNEGEMGFLIDTRRMNVALTRARRKLIVIGDSATVGNIPFYRDFIQYAESAGGYRSAWDESEG